MTTVFYTIVGDDYYYPVGTPKFINSFKKFHPDIDLVVFRQDMIDHVFKDKQVNFYNSKPAFAQLLYDSYDLVVNIDADHVVLGRLEEILKGDYDVACPINKNDYENTSVENVTEDMFLQGGLVASTSKTFWDVWFDRNKQAMDYKCKENDIMNLVIYNDMPDLKLKILDGEKDYYGCKSLGREKEFYMDEGRVMCRKERVYLYHHAKGASFPKLEYETMGFTTEVVQFMNYVSSYGTTVRYA